MTYEEATAYVVREKDAAYAFLPTIRSGKIAGGQAYLIVYDENYETDPDEWYEYNIHYNGGLFRSSSGEGDIFGPDDVPEEARTMIYLPADSDAVDSADAMLELFLLRLKGFSLEEANWMIDHMTNEQIVSCPPKPA